MLSQSLAPLQAYPHFVAWRLEWNAEREKWDKIPYSPVHGHKASSTNPADWGTYEQARAFQTANNMGGIGFVFTERDPFWFLDIDKAWDGARWSMIATELCARLSGVAVEISQSGTGLHLIGTGPIPPDHKNRNIPLGLELYTKERFVALTDQNTQGLATHAPPLAKLADLAERYFKREVVASSGEWTTEAVPEWDGPDDDAELIARALRSGQNNAAAAFGGATGQPTFADLWTANTDVLRAKWPAETTGGDFNHSSADQSLANLLAFWTGRNCERIERIMRMSGLARAKWDQRPDWLQETITKACGLVRTVYQQKTRAAQDAIDPGPPPEPEALEAAGIQPRQTVGLMLYSHQVEHFAGCVYIVSLNKVLTPKGQKLDQARFDVVYGGHEFVIAADGKKTTRSAWQAFTENENFPATTADRLCFRPELGSGGLIEDGGEVLANSYVAIDIPTAEGDPAPFLDLMRRQLPDERDQAILTNYLAGVVQNPGLKAQWWPVLQGLKGNGKTVYLTVMEYCVGARYTHLPGVGKMVRNGMNFNGWIDGKLFLGMEEIKGAHRREFFEEFKTTVTNRRLPIEGKGIEEATGDNRANGILTTNHRDGVPLEKDERRYAVFFMNQQVAGDLQRDGMTAAYFSDFHDWLFGREAYAHHGVNWGLRIIAGYLKNYQTNAELDPSKLAIWAPLTTSTAAAILSSHGRAEQEVVEAIEEDKPGFAGGWVSSIKLEELLDRKRISVPRGKRRELMQSLGYDYHPALGDGGRVNNVVAPDQGKPRLYCRVGSIAWHNMDTAAQVATAYSDAQLKASNQPTAGQAFSK